MTTDEQLLTHTATASPLFVFCILMTFFFSRGAPSEFKVSPSACLSQVTFDVLLAC